MSGKYLVSAGVLVAALMAGTSAQAGVSAAEAAKLGTSLTPLGAEKEGNADGTIPAYTGGLDKSNGTLPDYGAGIPDPFAGDKPLFSITAANMGQYADKLMEGTKQLLQKYPDTFRVDIYKTVRSAAFPKYVYENTLKNATAGSLVNHAPQNVWGGIPFPIPSSGEEAMWNHNLHFSTPSGKFTTKSYLITSEGQMVNTTTAITDSSYPYYTAADGQGPGDPIFWRLRFDQLAPPIRAGESVLNLFGISPDDDASWVYLTGQRRVRKLPNACCDTTHPASAGVFGYDEIGVWNGRTDRFDWTLVGKKEMYIPYNENKTLTQKSDADLIKGHHINPDVLRYELHRVWVVDAALAPGKRHTAPKGRYYIDEDSWLAVESDRWDANGEFWKVGFATPISLPEVPTLTAQMGFGFVDLISGTQVLNASINETTNKIVWVEKWPPGHFTADALVADSIR